MEKGKIELLSLCTSAALVTSKQCCRILCSIKTWNKMNFNTEVWRQQLPPYSRVSSYFCHVGRYLCDFYERLTVGWSSPLFSDQYQISFFFLCFCFSFERAEAKLIKWVDSSDAMRAYKWPSFPGSGLFNALLNGRGRTKSTNGWSAI